MKNKRTIFVSLVLVFSIILYVIPICEYFVFALLNQQVEINFILFWFELQIINQPNNLTVICLLFPYILLIVLIEAQLLFLKKSNLSKERFREMITALLLLGYLIIKIFYTAFQMAIRNREDYFYKTFQSMGVKFPVNLLAILFLIFLFFIYANRVSRKIKQYIN